ncbi:hypothetical protein [Pigmentiphaga daeguensis]|uniref:Uncharacterized protein n=1 Tax=Pigmentiphaga daeguensis TaxID=414049 RepID=A0ABP3L536_9BURK
MSKQNSAVERKDFSTPTNLAQAPQAGKIPNIASILESDFLAPMDSVAGSLMDLAVLFRTIDGIASQGLADKEERSALLRIKHLCNIGSYLGDDFGNWLDSAHETARDQHCPAIIAALGGEACARSFEPARGGQVATSDEIEGLRAQVALLKVSLAQVERENDELREAAGGEA